jgi:DNA-directed RNA polymerase subunit RPC12/RpoP
MNSGQMRAKHPLDDNDKRRLVLTLLARLRCAACGKPFLARDFALLEHQSDVWVLGVECRHCGESARVIVALHMGAEHEPLTDLMPEERREADAWPPITGDDVLDVHELLQECDGDLGILLDQ